MPDGISDAMIDEQVGKFRDADPQVREGATDTLVRFLNRDPEKVLPRLLDLFQTPPPPPDPEVKSRLGTVIGRKIEELSANNDLDALAFISGYLARRGLKDVFQADEVLEDRKALRITLIAPPDGARFQQPCDPSQERNYCLFQIPAFFTVTVGPNVTLTLVAWEYQDEAGLHSRTLVQSDRSAEDLRFFFPEGMVMVPKAVRCDATETIELRFIAEGTDGNRNRRVRHTVSRRLRFVCGSPPESLFPPVPAGPVELPGVPPSPRPVTEPAPAAPAGPPTPVGPIDLSAAPLPPEQPVAVTPPPGARTRRRVRRRRG